MRRRSVRESGETSRPLRARLVAPPFGVARRRRCARRLTILETKPHARLITPSRSGSALPSGQASTRAVALTENGGYMRGVSQASRGRTRSHLPRHVLVATDLSARSDRAVLRGAEIALQVGAARLTVLHVIEPVRLRGRATNTRTAERELRAQVQRLAFSSPRLRADVRVERGKPFVEIVRHARIGGADLIVVGAHGTHFVRGLLWGTTAERVVWRGDRVLVVRSRVRGPYKRVLAAVDFSESSRRVVESALVVAPTAKLGVLHVDDILSESRLRLGGASSRDLARYQLGVQRRVHAQMLRFSRTLGLAERITEHVVRLGRPAAVIPQVAAEIRADLVAIGTSARTGLPYLLLGSVAEHVLRDAPCDVLAVRHGAAHFPRA